MSTPKRLLLIACLLALSCISARPAQSASPDDGIYSIVVTTPTFANQGYVSVHQQGAVVVLIVIGNFGWSAGVGTRDNDVIKGTTYSSTGLANGTFSFVVAGGTLTGLMVEAGIAYSLAGELLFGPGPGPNDGIYSLVAVPGRDIGYLSVHQQGNNVILILALTEPPANWAAWVGVRSGDDIYGNAYNASGFYGAFSVTFTDATYTGLVSYPGYVFSLAGERVFWSF